MGGVTTAAAIEAMEQETGKSLFWATSQFLAPAPTERDFEIRVEVLGRGRRATRMRATLLHGDETILVAAGALGEADPSAGVSFCAVPSVPDSAECPRLETPDDGGLMSQLERRRAHRDEPGREAVWFRFLAGHGTSAGTLAILGDFLAGAHPDTRGSVGFDNTLRVVAPRETDWILADMSIAHIGAEVFHGSMRLFARSGELMAISSLTALRPPPKHRG